MFDLVALINKHVLSCSYDGIFKQEFIWHMS